MPSSIKAQLNSTVHANFTVAEINGAVFPFAAVAIQNVAGQQTLIDGIVSEVTIGGGDVNNFNQAITFVQRNLIALPGQSWVALRNNDETLLYFQDQSPGLGFIRTAYFTQPLVLESGQVYTAIVGLLPAAAFAAPADAYINVLGRQVTEGRAALPPLR